MTSEAEQDIVPTERQEAGIELTGNEETDHNQVEDEGDNYTLLGSASDDIEKQRDYKEYLRLVKEINYQNNILEGIKKQIHNINCIPCTTRYEQNDLKALYKCLEQEMQKLRSLIEKAMRLQNFGSRRRYKEIPLATTFDEDNMAPIQFTCKNLQVQTSRAASIKRQTGFGWPESSGETSELDKSCSCQNTKEILCGQMFDSEEIQFLKEILPKFEAYGCYGNKKYCQKKKQETNVCKETESMEEIRMKINSMQQTMNHLKEEICKQQVEKNIKAICPEQQKTYQLRPPSCMIDPAILHCCKKPPKAELFQKLNDNYLYLLTELGKKDEQLKELTKNLKTTCVCCTGNSAEISDGNADESELYLLRNRINEMKEEQAGFKCLMKEQSLQLEDYRNKYLVAQQKVEEQCALLEKLNMNNKRIEKQINLEVKEIRTKFQEKLNELLQFPKLLENEQIKLAKICKEKDELESKLVTVCKELKSLKSKINMPINDDEDYKSQIKRCQQELCQVKNAMDEIQRQRDMFCEQLRTTTDDLDTLRSESANIIARTKERAEHVKQHLQEQIDRLEKQLAQCRATACLSVSDRETVIREMQGQLTTLSYSFDTAQKQIKSLRNHIEPCARKRCKRQLKHFTKTVIL